MRGVLSPEAPRAQEGDKRGSPSVPAITSGSEVLGVKVLTSGVAWASTRRLGRGTGRKSFRGLHLARKMSRRRVRSEIADSTAPGPGGVLTGRLGGGLYVTRRAFSVGIIAEPTTGPKQPGRADRQRSPPPN